MWNRLVGLSKAKFALFPQWMLWILVGLDCFAMVIGGRMVGNRFAIIDFPETGGPITSRLCALQIA